MISNDIAVSLHKHSSIFLTTGVVLLLTIWYAWLPSTWMLFKQSVQYNSETTPHGIPIHTHCTPVPVPHEDNHTHHTHNRRNHQHQCPTHRSINWIQLVHIRWNAYAMYSTTLPSSHWMHVTCLDTNSSRSLYHPSSVIFNCSTRGCGLE